MNEKILKKIMAEYKGNPYISIKPSQSLITFKIQDGPIKEVGKNGEQIDHLGRIWLKMLKALQKKYPCKENGMTIFYIENAMYYQDLRNARRKREKIEGYNKEKKY